MQLLEPDVLFDPEPQPWPANHFCSRDGRWEKLLACPICRGTTVQFLGKPERRFAHVKPCGCPEKDLRVLFGCDDCGGVLTLAFIPGPEGIWLGCQWGLPLVTEAPALEEAGCE